MDDSAKFTRAIRLNVAAGVAMLASVALFLALASSACSTGRRG